MNKVRFLCKRNDGGKDSGVYSYNLIEWKGGFSIALLKFNPNLREAFHSHAFNAFTFWLKGEVLEEFPDKKPIKWNPLSWKYTPRENMHKITVIKPAWALTIRGKWVDCWFELRSGEKVTLTHGRKIIK